MEISHLQIFTISYLHWYLFGQQVLKPLLSIFSPTFLIVFKISTNLTVLGDFEK